MVAVAIGVTLKAFDGRFNHPLPSHTPPIYTLKGEYLILATPAGTRAVPEPTPITRAPSPRPKRPRKSAPPPP
jgi:hypothetical protein